MDAPVAPRPADFELTDADYCRVHRLRFPPISSYETIAEDAPRFLRALQPLRVAAVGGLAGALGAVAASVYNGAKFVDLIFGLLKFGFVGLISAFAAMIAVAAIIRPLYVATAALTVPGFKNYLAFRRSLEDYGLRQREYNQWQLRTAIDFWRSLSGVQFEREVAGLYKRLGLDVTLTPGTADGGVDIVLRSNTEVTAVQCKAYRGKVGVSVGRELVTAARDLGATKMMIASTNGASSPLQAYAAEKGIQIVTAETLVKMQAELDGMPVAHITIERSQDIAARLRALQISRAGS